MPEENIVIPVDDVCDPDTGNAFNGSPESDSQFTGGDLTSFGEPKSPPTPTTGTTDLRSDTPENHSDNDCASQNMAPDDSSGQNLLDENLSDTDADVTTIRRPSPKSEKFEKSDESKESTDTCDIDDKKGNTGSYQKDINYEDIVYDRHDGRYTKKFRSEDDEVGFRKECEVRGSNS